MMSKIKKGSYLISALETLMYKFLSIYKISNSKSMSLPTWDYWTMRQWSLFGNNYYCKEEDKSKKTCKYKRQKMLDKFTSQESMYHAK